MKAPLRKAISFFFSKEKKGETKWEHINTCKPQPRALCTNISRRARQDVNEMWALVCTEKNHKCRKGGGGEKKRYWEKKVLQKSQETRRKKPGTSTITGKKPPKQQKPQQTKRKQEEEKPLQRIIVLACFFLSPLPEPVPR